MEMEKKKQGTRFNVRLNYKYYIFPGDVQFYSLYLVTLVIITQWLREKSWLSRMNYGAGYLGRTSQWDAPSPTECDCAGVQGHF